MHNSSKIKRKILTKIKLSESISIFSCDCVACVRLIYQHDLPVCKIELNKDRYTLYILNRRSPARYNKYFGKQIITNTSYDNGDEFQGLIVKGSIKSLYKKTKRNEKCNKLY